MIDVGRLERDGCGLAAGVVPSDLIGRAQEDTDAVDAAGVRNPLRSVPSLRAIADCDELRNLVAEVVGDGAVLSRAILFDKTSARNWPVPPHRDVSIAVAERFDVPGYGPWSVKNGVVHVQPPAEVLAGMWTLRVAIDRADESNGALRIQLGSHAQAEPTGSWQTFAIEPGDVVLMRPLAVHASTRCSAPSRRRVLHLEWASLPLAPPLTWAEA